MTRTRICFYLILLIPLAVYWSTVFHEFAFRDDYAYLHEAREQPGKIVKFAASQGRPLYGALLETSFTGADQVEHLTWLRLGTIGLLTLLSLALWRQLYQSGWTEVEAMVIGLGVALLPAAQVVGSWASSWPHVLALLLAVAGFAAVEAELERGGLKRVVALLGGIMIYAIATLIYQSNALFAVVPIAAVLLVRPGREPYTDGRWCSIHLAILGLGVGLGHGLAKFLFHNGIFQESPRLKLEEAFFSKAVWFFTDPLPNALGLYALRDNFGTGAVIFWLTVATLVALIAYSYRVDTHRAAAPAPAPEPEVGVNYEVKPGQAAPVSKVKWWMCLGLLPLIGHGVSLAAAERVNGYRTLFALSGLVLVLVIFAIRSLHAAGRLPRMAYYAAFGVLLAGGAMMARQNAAQLIAIPQGHEWEMTRAAIMRADFRKPLGIYVITPQVNDRVTKRIFSDEFGSLSADSDWVPREMVHAAVHSRFPEKLPKGGSYTVTLGRTEPAAKAYDLVIDLRKLRNYREDL